jgi:hypothetical protein
MNNATIKKWMVLLALLLVTLVLVWQAPQPEQETQMVSTSRNTSDLVRSASQLPAPSVIDDDIELKQRQIVTEKVDLFDRPKIKQAIIATPISVVKTMPVTQIPIPFRYIGMLQEHQQITLFLMEGNRLHLANEGDTFNEHFQLQSIDIDNKQLVWLYLPSNETQKMSIKK